MTPLALLRLCQSLGYYFTYPPIEYRHAIDPVIVTLVVYGLAESFRFGGKGVDLRDGNNNQNHLVRTEQNTNDDESSFLNPLPATS